MSMKDNTFGTLFIIAAVIFFGYVIMRIIAADIDKVGKMFFYIAAVFIPIIIVALVAERNRSKK
jgi:membrane protein DedA with SNARE-associated domain